MIAILFHSKHLYSVESIREVTDFLITENFGFNLSGFTIFLINSNKKIVNLN